MADPEPDDAAGYARRHAGELDTSLTLAQRDLLGRVIARRIERGAKLDQIARAAATALFDVPADRARRLGRDEALRAFAWESLHQLRAAGATHVVLSPAHDACPACVDAGGTYATERVPIIPVARCAHPGGCRCRYLPAATSEPGAPHTVAVDAPAAPSGASPSGTTAPPVPAEPGQPARPWYRTRPPRPHGPRWSEEEREVRRPPPRQSRPASPPRPNPPAPPPHRQPAPRPPSPPRRQPAPHPPRPHRPARDTG